MEARGKCTNKWRVPALWAMAVFLLLNLGLSLANGFDLRKKPQERGAVHQACESAIDQFNNCSPAPRVVLMGSSLVMAPVWSSDSRHFANVADVYHHHQSLLLREKLNARGEQIDTVFSFALPGAMVSDVYLLSEKLLAHDHKPELLIYGLAPRDFMDDLLTGETRTAVFQRLMELSDLPRLGDLYLSTWQEKVDFVANNVLYLYGKRCRYQDKLAFDFEKLLSRLPTIGKHATASGALDEQKFLQDDNREQVWQQSISEYKARYKRFNSEQFVKQTEFLKALLESAQQAGIKIVLVNMPLTRENLAVMPAGFYQRYLQTVQVLARDHRCQFLDFQQQGVYPESAFYDTVHLNAKGGDQFITSLANWISDHDARPIAVQKAKFSNDL